MNLENENISYPINKTNNKSIELEIALENRAFEIQLFWQRTNYFLVLITALGIGVFTIKNDILLLLISFFGIFSSYLWFVTNLGSKFWQESWEVEVTQLAKEQKIRSFEKNISQIELQVKKSLFHGDRNKEKSCFRKWIDGLTLNKYSVTHHMIILSFGAILLWCTATLVFLFNYFTGQ